MRTSPKSVKIISFDAVHGTTSCGFLFYHYFCIFSVNEMFDLAVHIIVVKNLHIYK